jgi:translation initiation factor IF-1
MEPTVEQLRAMYRMSVRASNLLQPINVVRLDERTKRIYILVGDTIQIEIYPNGEVTFP